MSGVLDVLGFGRLARAAIGGVARARPDTKIRVVPRRPERVAALPLNVELRDLDHLTRSRAPLFICASVDEGALLRARPKSARGRAVVARANLSLLHATLAPSLLAERTVIVVTNPVEPIVAALAEVAPSANVVGFGLATDRARIREVLEAAFDVDRRVTRALAIGGTHATTAVPCLEAISGLYEHLRQARPEDVARRLHGARSPYSTRPIDARDLVSTADRAAYAERPYVLVDAAAGALTASEFVGDAPPFARAARELARAMIAAIDARGRTSCTLGVRAADPRIGRRDRELVARAEVFQ